MKKVILCTNFCEECNTIHSYLSGEQISCDSCGEDISKYQEVGHIPPIEVRICYTNYDFCNYRCLLKFVLEEIKKENPRTDIEFGKEK